MAVYPDRIILKSSTSARGTIENAIGATGEAAIAEGEVVIGLEDDSVRLYTRSENGNIVSIGSSSTGAVIVSTTEPTVNNDGQPLAEGDLWFNPSNGSLQTYYPSPTNYPDVWVPLAAGVAPSQTLGSLSDVLISNVSDGQLITYNSNIPGWENVSAPLGTVQSIDVVGTKGIVTNSDGPIDDFGTFIVEMEDTSVIAGNYAAANITVNSRGQITAASNGSSGTNPLNSLDALNDVSTAGEVPGDLLQLNNANQYVPKSIQEVLGGDGDSGAMGVSFPAYELAGIDGFYESITALQADGFTHEPPSNTSSGGAFYLSPPAQYLSVNYLGFDNLDIGGMYINPNGGVGFYPVGNGYRYDLNSGLLSVPPETPLYVSFFSGSNRSQLVGWKEISRYGVTWLCVRSDHRYPSGRVAGYAVEVWFGLNGQIRVQVGAPIGSSFGISGNENTAGVSVYGQKLSALAGINAGGRYQALYARDFMGGAVISDVVDVSGITPSDSQVLAWNATEGEWRPQTVSGVSGSGANIGFYSVETQVSGSGSCQFSSIGTSGLFQKISSTGDAWVVFYASSSARVLDASRLYGDPVSEGSGVLAEYTLQAGVEQLASPGTSYFNADSSPLGAIYAAVRTVSGDPVETELTVKAYGLSGVETVRGGKFGSQS